MLISNCKKTLIALLLTCFLGLTQGFAQTPLSPEAQEVLRKGGQAAALALASYDEHFIDKPLWREAVNYGLELQRLAPDNPQTYRFLGQVYSSISFYSRAWEAWERYKQLGGVINAQTAPYLAKASSWLGNVSFRAKNYEAALVYYETLFALEPTSEEANQHLALSHIALGNPAQASPYLVTLSKEFPNKVDYVNLLSRTQEQASYGVEASQLFYEGLDYYAQNAKDKALEAFDKASKLSASYRKAFVWAGRVSQELGQAARAVEYWKQAIVLNENDEEALQSLALAEGQKQWGVDAFNSFKQGLSYYQQGLRGEAFWSFQRATQLNPRFSEAYAWLGQLSVENRDFNAALGFYGYAQQLEPANPVFQSAYGEASRLLSEATVATTAPQTTDISQIQTATTPTITQTTTANPPTPTPSQEPTTSVPPVSQPPVSQEPATTTASVSQESTTSAPPVSQPPVSQEPATTTASVSQEPAPVTEIVIPTPPVSSSTTVSSPPRSVVVEPSSAVLASASPAPSLNPTPAPVLEAAVAAPTPEPPKPQPQASPAAGGPAIVMLNVNYKHDSPERGGSGAFSFFDSPSSLLSNLKSPVDYAGGKLYQRINVSSKPSGEAVRYQLCIVHNDNLSIGPACSTSSTLRFEEPGIYEVSQSLSSFSNFEKIDWSKGIQQVMLILQDSQGNTLDNRVAFTSDSGTTINLEAFYPMQVKYSAILVPLGGTFPGWP